MDQVVTLAAMTAMATAVLAVVGLLGHHGHEDLVAPAPVRADRDHILGLAARARGQIGRHGGAARRIATCSDAAAERTDPDQPG